MENAELARRIAGALSVELTGRRSRVKIIGRWTGAGDRAIKNWLAGRAIPNGQHLVALMRHSEVVTVTILAAAGRTRRQP